MGKLTQQRRSFSWVSGGLHNKIHSVEEKRILGRENRQFERLKYLILAF